MRLSERTVVRLWSQDWIEGCHPVPDTHISFGGAYLPCAWYETMMAVVQACGSASVGWLMLDLSTEDYRDSSVPWERLFLSVPALKALFPWKQVMDCVYLVEGGHVIGAELRARVVDFDPF